MELGRPIVGGPVDPVPRGTIPIQVAVVESGRSLQYLHELLPRCH